MNKEDHFTGLSSADDDDEAESEKIKKKMRITRDQCYKTFLSVTEKCINILIVRFYALIRVA